MKKSEFYQKYANTPLTDRFKLLNNAYNSPLAGMTLNSIYLEIYDIDERLRHDELRREELLQAVEKYLNFE